MKSKYSHTLILTDVDYNYMAPATCSETFGPVFGASLRVPNLLGIRLFALLPGPKFGRD